MIKKERLRLYSRKYLDLLPDYKGLISVLEQDPRPSYQDDPNRVYGFEFAGFEVRFRVKDSILRVLEVFKL